MPGLVVNVICLNVLNSMNFCQIHKKGVIIHICFSMEEEDSDEESSEANGRKKNKKKGGKKNKKMTKTELKRVQERSKLRKKLKAKKEARNTTKSSRSRKAHKNKKQIAAEPRTVEA